MHSFIKNSNSILNPTPSNGIPISAPRRQNYTFMGWSVVSDGITATYTAQNVHTAPKNGTTLYTIWWDRASWDGTIANDYAGGNGTAVNPWQISNGEQLALLAQRINSGSNSSSNFILTNDIYLNDPNGWENWNSRNVPTNSWTPIGNFNTPRPFKGNFDGRGYAIKGIYVNLNGDHSGLFGYVEGGTISNLGIEQSYICNYDGVAGSIVGRLRENGTVINCHNTGIVESSAIGGNGAGGIVGRMIRSKVINSYNTGMVKSGSGIAGVVEEGSAILNNYNSGIVGGGGIVGSSNSYARVEYNYFLKTSTINNRNFVVSGTPTGLANNRIFEDADDPMLRTNDNPFTKANPITIGGIVSEYLIDALKFAVNYPEVIGIPSMGTTPWILESAPKHAPLITVSFDSDGGSEVGTIAGTYGKPYNYYCSLPTPKKTDFNFDGWWTEQGGTGKRVTGNNYVFASAHTLYAKWVPKPIVSWIGLTANGTSGIATTTQLTLTFDKDPVGLTAGNITITGATNGTLSGAGNTRILTITNISVVNGSNVNVSVTSPSAIKIVGSDRSTPVYIAEVNWLGLTANGTSWTATTTQLTLTFDKDPIGFTVNNITVIGATKGTLTGSGTTRVLAISNITVGNGGTVVVNLTNPNGTTFTSTQKSVIVWTANVFIIIYDANQPSDSSETMSGTMENSSHIYDTASHLSPNNYFLQDRTFMGWNTQPDGSGTSYADGQIINGLSPVNNATITLYAQWSKLPIINAIWDGTYLESDDPYDVFDGGNGSLTDPWQIGIGEQLAWLANAVAVGTEWQSAWSSLTVPIAAASYILTDNIFLNDISVGCSWYENEDELNYWSPIGTFDNPFNGNFNGSGYAIYGIYINSEDNYHGLFGRVSGNGIICNLGVEQSYIKGADYVGGIAGFGMNIFYCYNTGKVFGNNLVGGIAGFGSNIWGCYNTGDIMGGISNDTTAKFVGGIAGFAGARIFESYNAGCVTGNDCVGGVVGYIEASGLINNCYNIGEITGTTRVGGIAGALVGRPVGIVNSYNTGDIGGINYVGGIVGYITSNGSAQDINGLIANCYNQGKLIRRAATRIGGIVGYVGNYVTIINNYSSGTFFSEFGILTSIGGIVGEVGGIENVIRYGFWRIMNNQNYGYVGISGGGFSVSDMAVFHESNCSEIVTRLNWFVDRVYQILPQLQSFFYLF